MEQKEAFFQAACEVFWMFKLENEFEGEAEDVFLTSADPVNVLRSFEQTVKGNIVLGMSNDTALKIIAKMFGQERKELDFIGKSALAELVNMISGTAIGKLMLTGPTHFTTPTLVNGKSLFLLIGRSKVTKLLFRLNNMLITLAYSIE